MSESGTRKSETHFKVRLPIERTIRLRDAEREMTLAEDVKTDSGQLLFPGGTVLNGERINKLRNFSIRTVRVEDTETRWIDEGTYQNLPEDTEVLEEKRIPVEPETEPDTKTETDPDPETTSSAFNFLESTESPKRIADFVEALSNNLGDDEEDLLESVRDLVGKTESVEDLFSYLLRQIGNLEDSKKRKTLLNELYDLGLSEGEARDADPEDPELPVDLKTKLDRLDNEKRSLRTDILDFLHGNPEALEGLSQDEVPEADLRKTPADTGTLPEGLEMNLDRDLLEKLIPLLLDWLRNQESSDEGQQTFEDVVESDIGDSLEELVRSSGKLTPETIDEFLDEMTNQPVANPAKPLRETMEGLREGEWDESIGGFANFLSQSGYNDPNSTFEEFSDEAQSLRSEQDSIEETIQLEAGEDSDLREIIREHMKFNGHDYSDVLRKTDVSDETIDTAEDFRDRRREVVLEFWEHLRDHLPNLLQSVEEEQTNQILESVQDTTDRIARYGSEGAAESLTADQPGRENLHSHTKERLATAREEENYELIKRASRLPADVIEQFQTSYRDPAETDKWQDQLLTTFREIIEELVLVLRVPQSAVEKFRKDVGNIMDKQNEPFSLFLQPPSADQYLLVHAYNTALLNVMVALKRDLSLLESQKLLLAGALADVGMTVIPESLYLKEGDLTVRAANEVSKHPIYSRKIAKYIFGKGHTVPKLIHQHQERTDGSGYPQGLEGDEIHFLARILAVSDAYTARIENRPYRSPQLPDRALKELENQAGELDEGVLKDVRSLFGYYPNGSVVKLTNQKLAFVKDQNPEAPADPTVYVLTDENRNKLDSPERKNLSEHEDVGVQILVRT